MPDTLLRALFIGIWASNVEWILNKVVTMLAGFLKHLLMWLAVPHLTPCLFWLLTPIFPGQTVRCLFLTHPQRPFTRLSSVGTPWRSVKPFDSVHLNSNDYVSRRWSQWCQHDPGGRRGCGNLRPGGHAGKDPSGLSSVTKWPTVVPCHRLCPAKLKGWPSMQCDAHLLLSSGRR